MKRKFNAESASKAIKTAAKMPPLHHQLPDQPFDTAKSEVINWLCSQPDIRQSVFSHFHDKGAIVFDQESKKWHGVVS